jgi:hypothetical protein
MYLPADVNTPFFIDLGWWQSRGRNLGRFLAEIVGDESAAAGGGEPLDYIDPDTAEVLQLDPLWSRVLIHHAHRPEYITASTPLANAVLRALIENVNRPMTAVDMYRRINRTSPETLLRLLRVARTQYGIVPAVARPKPARKTK